MSGIETVGGKCPHCGKVLLQKHESSGCGLMFDACIFCGFYSSDVEFDAKEAQCVFQTHILTHGLSTIEELQAVYASYTVNPEHDYFYPAIFDYSKFTAEEIAECVLDFSTITDWTGSVNWPSRNETAQVNLAASYSIRTGTIPF